MGILQIQICQNLAGVDKEYCSKLGWKLRGNGESLPGRRSLRSGRDSENIAGLIPQKVEDNLESSACTGTLSGQSSSPPPTNRLPEAVYDQGRIGSFQTSDVDTTERASISPAKEDGQEKRSNANVHGSDIPAMTEKPHSISAKLAGAAGKLSSSRLSHHSEPVPKLEDGMSRWSSSVKIPVLEDANNAREGEHISTEDVIERELSNIRKQVAAGKLTDACGLAAQVCRPPPYFWFIHFINQK